MTAGGFVKMSSPAPTITAKQMSIVTNKMSEKDNAPSSLTEQQKREAKKSNQINQNGSKNSSRFENSNIQNYQVENSLNVLQKSNYDAEISDIDLEFKVEEDEDKSKLIELNFKDGEGLIGKSPFPHWTINRQMYQSQMQSLQNEKPQEQKRFHKENIRD